MALITTSYAQAAAVAETIPPGSPNFGAVWTDIGNIIDGDDATFGYANFTGTANTSILELDAVGPALATVLPPGANVQGMLVRVVLQQTVADQIFAGGTWFATSGAQDGINQEPDQFGTILTTKTTVVFDGTHSIDGTLHAVVEDRRTDWGLSSFNYARATAATLDFQFASYIGAVGPSTLRIYSIEFAATYAPGIRIYDTGDAYSSALSPSDSDTARGTSLLAGPAAATTGYTLEIDPATWDLGTGTVELGVGATKTVHLRGTDRDTCIINDASNTAGSNPLIHPASGSVIEDITISLADEASGRAGLGCSTASNMRAFTGAVLNRVKFDVHNDAIIMADTGVASITLNDCIVNASYDAYAHNGAGFPAHSGVLNNCTLTTEATAETLNARCVYATCGTVVLNNCTLTARDASDLATAGVWCESGAASVILNNCTIIVESANDSGVYGLYTGHASASIVMNGGSIAASTTGLSTVYDAYAEAGSITLNNVQRSGEVSGDVTIVNATGFRGDRTSGRSSRPLGGVR